MRLETRNLGISWLMPHATPPGHNDAKSLRCEAFCFFGCFTLILTRNAGRIQRHNYFLNLRRYAARGLVCPIRSKAGPAFHGSPVALLLPSSAQTLQTCGAFACLRVIIGGRVCMESRNSRPRVSKMSPGAMFETRNSKPRDLMAHASCHAPRSQRCQKPSL